VWWLVDIHPNPHLHALTRSHIHTHTYTYTHTHTHTDTHAHAQKNNGKEADTVDITLPMRKSSVKVVDVGVTRTVEPASIVPLVRRASAVRHRIPEMSTGSHRSMERISSTD
jgi:hypothetical protein